MDRITGAERNLTNTPDRNEFVVQYWPYADALVFYSLAKEEYPSIGGALTMLQTDGSGYTILDEFDLEMPTISPDGQSMVTLGGYLYRHGMSGQGIDFEVVNAATPITASLVLPAWSPDSQSIAWSVDIVDQEGELFLGMGVLDLEKKELQLFHTYTTDMGEGFPPAPIWSPDGKWLALYAYDADPERAGLWAIRADGSEEHYLGDCHSAVWSPDSRWIALSNASLCGGREGENLLVEVGEWKPYRIDLPESYVKEWIDGSGTENWANMTFFDMATTLPTYMVTEAGANMSLYEEPSLDAPVLRRLQPGDLFELTGEFTFKGQDAWWQVHLDALDVDGWIIENPTWYTPQE